MEIFLVLLLKLLPLYALIILGMLCGKFLNIDRGSISLLMIYSVTPIIVFYGVSQAKINLEFLSLPVLFFILCSFISICAYKISQKTWHDIHANLIGFAAGNGNTGYFGLPVAILLFGKDALGLAIGAGLGFILYENSVGVFVLVSEKGNFKKSLLKVLKLPSLYAFFAGIVASYLSIPFSEEVEQMFNRFLGTYTVLGMMIIGLALSRIERAAIDFKFIAYNFIVKFLVWPSLVLLLIYLDNSSFSFFNEQTQKIMILMSIVPMAANTVSWAIIVNAHPQKTAVTVLLSTIFALAYIPFMVTFLM